MSTSKLTKFNLIFKSNSIVGQLDINNRHGLMCRQTERSELPRTRPGVHLTQVVTSRRHDHLPDESTWHAIAAPLQATARLGLEQRLSQVAFHDHARVGRAIAWPLETRDLLLALVRRAAHYR